MTILDSEWIPVDRRITKTYHKQCDDGFLSYKVLPQNVPNMIRFGHDTIDRRYIVAFRYYGYERSEEVVTEQGVIVKVQDYTRIVNRIEIPEHLVHPDPVVPCNLPDLLERQIAEAMVEMSIRTDYENSNTCIEYFELVQDIIHKYKDELFASVSAAA